MCVARGPLVARHRAAERPRGAATRRHPGARARTTSIRGPPRADGSPPVARARLRAPPSRRASRDRSRSPPVPFAAGRAAGSSWSLRVEASAQSLHPIPERPIGGAVEASAHPRVRDLPVADQIGGDATGEWWPLVLPDALRRLPPVIPRVDPTVPEG